MALEVGRRRIGSGERAIEIIDIVGRLDTAGSAVIRSSVQEILKEGCPRIAVDMAQCVEIHRETMGTFHSLGRACQRAGGKLVIFGATGDVLDYLTRFGDRSLAPWFSDEKAAIVALGGQIQEEVSKEKRTEPPVVVALGADPIFRAVFWKLSALGGRAIAKFDNIEACSDYLAKRPIHSIIIDGAMQSHEIVKLIRHIRTTPSVKNIGIFVVGSPMQRNFGHLVIEQGANNFVPYTFRGEDILAKLDRKVFFERLKEVYASFDARAKAKESR